MELIIEEKKNQPISYEGILKNMNLKVVDGKLSQDEPKKKMYIFILKIIIKIFILIILLLKIFLPIILLLKLCIQITLLLKIFLQITLLLKII